MSTRMASLPVLWHEQSPSETRDRVSHFLSSVATIFEAWVNRRESTHTQRAYRSDVMCFVAWRALAWPEEADLLLRVSIADVVQFRQHLLNENRAPKTINRRISSLSSFYKYLAAAAAEMRLPITVPNPAHAQFIARSSTDPIRETKSLSASRARQLMALPAGEDVLGYRDRALLKVFLYTGARLSSICALRVEDFTEEGDSCTLCMREKGAKRRTIGIHFSAGAAIADYLRCAQISDGPLFRPRLAGPSTQLANRHFHPTTLWRLLCSYLRRLPSGDQYVPHSLRATTATLLLEAGEDITRVQHLLGHRHITTTQIYDKRRRLTQDSASHHVPL